LADKMTDNSFLSDKVALRMNNLPPGDIVVLDCYSGKGLVWAAVQRSTGRNIKTLPIDRRSDKDDFHLPGDNLEYLNTLDLSKFNVIDLDAYGIPFEQIECLVRRRYKGMVFITAIQSVMGRLPDAMLKATGFSQEQIDKAPTLLCKRGFQYLLQYLANAGVKRIRHRSYNRKHYLAMQFGCSE
jgi:hypothetical protein